MGSFSDFFAMRLDELDAVLPGWKVAAPPLEAPVEFTIPNPYTGEPMTVRSWAAPDQPEIDDNAVEHPKLYGPGRARVPTVEWKWIGHLELLELEAAVLGVDLAVLQDRQPPRGLVGPGIVVAMRPEVVELLAGAGPADLQTWAERWLKTRAEDTFPRWSTEDLTELLTELSRLCANAKKREAGVYLSVGG